MHSMHRAASQAKHRTAASFRSVFSSKSSPNLRTIGNGEIVQSNVTHLPRTEEIAPQNSLNSRYHQETITVSNVSDDDTSDEDGYVTASEDPDFEDRDSESAGPAGGGASGGAESGRLQRTRSTDHDLIRAPSNSKNSNPGLGPGLGPRLRSDPSQLRGYHSDGEGPPHAQFSSQLHPLNELRDTVADLDSDSEGLKQVDDATLMRFLKARNMDVGKASDMFIKDWRWRKQFAPRGYISEDEIPNQLKAEKTYLQGIDKEGRPVMIILGSKHYSRGRDMNEFKKLCFYSIEKAIASMPEGKEQFVTIIDLAGTAYRNMDISATIAMVDLLQAHYPERMALLLAVHVSGMVQGPYKLVEPAIDVKTRKKIRFVSNDEDYESLLREAVGEEVLPKGFGGTGELIPIQYARINRETSFPSRAVHILHNEL